MKYLFLCLGNRGRSQIAEGYFNKYNPLDSCISAGLEAKHSGESVPDLVKMVMAEEKIDISHQITKAINKEIVISCDKIISMCPINQLPDYILESCKVEYWDIPDPKNKGIDNLRKIRNIIKEKILNLKG